MKREETNWGGDLLHRVPLERQADYTKACVRLNAHHENDELLCIADYLDIHTRINCDTSDRMERAAQSSEALTVRMESAVLRNEQMMERTEQDRKEMKLAQREIEHLRHRERLSARYRRILQRRFFLSVSLVSILVSAILCGLMEFHLLSEEKEVRQQALQQVNLATRHADKEREEEMDLIEGTNGLLRWLKSQNIILYESDVTFTDGSKGFCLYSPAATSAQMIRDANGQPVGAIYFRTTADGK
jgi:hypothetical protein